MDNDIFLNLGNDDEEDIMNSFKPVKRDVVKKVESALVRQTISKPRNDKVDRQLPAKKPISKQVQSKDSTVKASSPESSEESDSDGDEGPTQQKPNSSELGNKVENASLEPTKKKNRPELADDPSQFHVNPNYLSRNALKEPRKPVQFSNLIFTRTSFESMDLNPKIVEILQNKISDGGMNLATATRIQSVSVPILQKRQNVLLKSQTGSGKTLAYLLPMLNDLSLLQPKVQRSDGTRALIIAPTRELCSQIVDVLTKLTQACVWLVGGSITGGEKRKSEKARLRKGVTVLVSTPGRLLDHLRTTESLHMNALRWLILDEADRLLDMGFEQTILEVISIVRGKALDGLKATLVPGSISKRCHKPSELVHVMVSATMTQSVQQLALPLMDHNPFIMVDADAENVDTIRSTADIIKSSSKPSKYSSKDGVVSFEDSDEEDGGRVDGDGAGGQQKKGKQPSVGSHLQKDEKIDTPQQLAQYYMNVTCKWRLAALMSFLRTKVGEEKLKVMVFFSTCDSVDYHALLLREAQWPEHLDQADTLPLDSSSTGASSSTTTASSGKQGMKRSIHDEYDAGVLSSRNNLTQNSSGNGMTKSSTNTTLKGVGSGFTGGLLGSTVRVFRLHGNMAHSLRQEVYRQFCELDSCVLLCTDVAARGLDLPHVDWILQYDPPCDITDYAHRAGRTARKGLGGSSLLFLLPTEAPFIPLLHSHSLHPEALSLQSLFSTVSNYIPGSKKFKNVDELAAVILQRRLELVVLGNKILLSAGQQAFRSFVRAYASHSAELKGIFQVQKLHLGHVAKSFALRESPREMRNKQDILGEIANGKYAVEDDKDTKAAMRREKYSLSSQLKNKKQKSSGDEPFHKPQAIPRAVGGGAGAGVTGGIGGSDEHDATDSTKEKYLTAAARAAQKYKPGGEESMQKIKRVSRLQTRKAGGTQSVRKLMKKSMNSEFSM